MNHINRISKATPIKANMAQQVFCQFNQMLAGILEAFGGESPKANYISGKCTLPSS